MGTITWSGNISGNLGTPGNWIGSVVPGSTDTANFDATGKIMTVTDTSVTSVGGWSFTGAAYTVTVFNSVFFEGGGILLNGGSATIDVTSSGTLTFQNNSSGGAAAFNVASGGTLNFSGATGNATVGSLAGDGEVDLGASQTLTVGSGSFSGHIFGTTGSSLVKDGPGTLTLSGNNVLSHITVLDGTLDLASIGGDGGADITLGATPATLQIENAALGFGGHFNSPILFQGTGPVVVDLPGLLFSPVVLVSYDVSHLILSVDTGTAGVFFNVWRARLGEDFSALDDHNGGTEIVPAIIETRPNKHVDANHHPPGQLSLTSGPLCIDVRGDNDTVNAPGGNFTIICEARGDLFHARQGDEFVYKSLKASPPNHPDTLTHFKQAQGASHAQGVSHAQGAKIDLYDLHFFVPHQHHLVFIGAQTFANYHHHHHSVFGMVRAAGGVVEVNVNHNLAPDFEIKVPGAHLHLSDFTL